MSDLTLLVYYYLIDNANILNFVINIIINMINAHIGNPFRAILMSCPLIVECNKIDTAKYITNNLCPILLHIASILKTSMYAVNIPVNTGAIADIETCIDCNSIFPLGWNTTLPSVLPDGLNKSILTIFAPVIIAASA